LSSEVNFKEFVSGFVLEADEHLHSVNRNLVATSEALKQGKPEPRAVRELFRSLHTIKGLAAMVGVEPIVNIAHEMETILRTADRAGGRISEKALDLILQGTRALEERVHAVSKNGIESVPRASMQLLEALSLEQGAQTGIEKKHEAQFVLPPEILNVLSVSDREQINQGLQNKRNAVLIEFQPSPEKAEKGLNITSVRERLGKIGELVKVVPRSSSAAPTGIAFSLLLITDASHKVLAETSGTLEGLIQKIEISEAQEKATPILNDEFEESPEWSPTDHSSIRVDIRRLDEALERVADLVVTRSKLSKVEANMTALGVDTKELKAVILENTRLLKRLRNAVTEARMVPLADLLQRLPLVVRGLTKDTDKKVNFSIQAGTAEIDKAVADKIFPAVVHLIRNAVDHAIESQSERRNAGKAETAQLSVVCDGSSGTSLTITITDDGRGIDREAVARKSGKKIAKNDEELLQQIATPGLSTMDNVTHTSGRGMGMEIVKRTIELLGGALSLSSEKSKGTQFVLRVPVSITIVDVLSFVAGGQTFVVPVAMIDEIIEIDQSSLVKSPVPGKKGPEPRLVLRRGEAIPLLGLESLLQLAPRADVSKKALIVNQNRGAIAFGVDRMLGQQEVVVRPLDNLFIQKAGVSGATDLGDGLPTIVLDLTTLGASIMKNARASS
jgi:two-component system chemotaxis sensor kinase CheA